MPAPPYNLAQQPLLQKRGEIFIGPENFIITGTAPTMTRTAKGNVFAAIGASATTIFTANIDSFLHSFFSPLVAYNYKGPNWAFNLNYAQVIYLAAAVNLVQAKFGLSYSTFGPPAAAAPTVVDLMAPTNLTLTFGANIIVSQVAPANPSLMAPFGSELLAEVTLQTAAAASCNFYGVLLDVMTD